MENSRYQDKEVKQIGLGLGFGGRKTTRAKVDHKNGT